MNGPSSVDERLGRYCERSHSSASASRKSRQVRLMVGLRGTDLQESALAESFGANALAFRAPSRVFSGVRSTKVIHFVTVTISYHHHHPLSLLVFKKREQAISTFGQVKHPSTLSSISSTLHRHERTTLPFLHSMEYPPNHSQASSHWQPAIRDRPADTKEQLPVSMHFERLFPSGKPVH